MKKIFSYGLVILSLVLLVACSQNGAKSSSTTEAGKVRLIVKENDNTIDEKVSFKKGDTVMDVLKNNYEVEESDGFITAIDGIKQDKDAGKYWMFDVNDKTAAKAANKIKVKDGDKIEFYQKIYKDK